MIGYFRLLLASLVLYSHLNYPLWNFFDIKINQGVFAVFCFYLISGYFSALIFDRFKGQEQFKNFYLDRFLRIMPTFIVVMLSVMLIGLIWYEPSLKASQADYYNPVNWILGLIQPLNGVIAFFFRGNFPYGDFGSFTPAPSLALEVQYFFVFPFIAILRTKFIIPAILAIATLVIYITFKNDAELLESFTYRYLIGVLPLFLLGYNAYCQYKKPINIWVTSEVLGISIGIAYFLILILIKPTSTVWLGEMALAMIACPIILRWLMKCQSFKYDKFAGYISYGVFLVHIPILRYANFVGNSYMEFFYTLGIAIVLASMIHIFVERPILELRRNLANKQNGALNE